MAPQINENGVTEDNRPPSPRLNHAPYHARVPSLDGPMLIRRMSNDRPELGMNMRRGMTTVDASKEAVVVVTPYSTGCCIALEIQKRGFSIIALFIKGFAEEMKTHVPLSCESLRYMATVEEGESLEHTAQLVREAAGTKRVVGVIAGGEAGVDFADALSEYMMLRSNGTSIANRRDKKVQQELIKEAGMRAVRQAAGTKFEEVEEFLKNEPYPVVVKPTDSAGSDGVKLCNSFEEAKEHFNTLLVHQKVNGGVCELVLCQEFLKGKEYIVDHVSREGVHKTMMVWVYERKPTNNSQFVLYSILPIDPNSEEAKQLIPYTQGVLDVLGVKNGPSHGEVIMTEDGPCLVEMNCRANGGDGTWGPLCRALTGGYSQIEASADAYLEKQAFSSLPSLPPSPFKASGLQVHLVSFKGGTVKSAPVFDIVEKLPSFVYYETGVKPGTKVVPTIDLVTGCGIVILLHEDPAVLEKDLKFIREMEVKNELFVFEEDERPAGEVASN